MQAEIAIRLTKPLEHYLGLMQALGATNMITFSTHEEYWAPRDITGMSEETASSICVSFVKITTLGGLGWNGQQSTRHICKNYKALKRHLPNVMNFSEEEFKALQKRLKREGWRVVKETRQTDYQYLIQGASTIISFRELEGAGLALYFGQKAKNKWEAPANRKKLIEELNSYGFDIAYGEPNYSVRQVYLTKKPKFY